ncbi:MAG: Lipopolysaccharide export system ATP-binding protein LptB, partial [Planctomycetota bacterium]
VLLTDHQFRETLEVCNRSYVIREGSVFAYGNSEEIYANPDVAKHYLGERNETVHSGHSIQKPHDSDDWDKKETTSRNNQGPVRFDGP